MKHRIFVSLLSLLLLSACALLPRAERAEPGILVVRNKSGADIAELRVTGPPRDVAEAVEYGALPSVPSGLSRVFVRPMGAPPITDAVHVLWLDAAGTPQQARIDLDEALTGPTSSPDLALVLELMPGGELRAHAEDRSVGAN